jgi:hypothetical protein
LNLVFKAKKCKGLVKILRIREILQDVAAALANGIAMVNTYYDSVEVNNKYMYMMKKYKENRFICIHVQ